VDNIVDQNNSVVLVTGGNGFIGRHLCVALLNGGYKVKVAIRSKQGLINLPSSVSPVFINDISSETKWEKALEGVDCVVHLANRAHVMREGAGDALSMFREVNVEGTINLAEQANSAGVKRFIFVSSVKVNGEVSSAPFSVDDMPAPEDPYGVSKMEAEQKLRSFCSRSNLELVMVRPPLVYGAGVKGNFATLLRMMKFRIPLPLGGVVNNRRSLVSVDNLVDLLITCIFHPAAVGQTFFVSDNDDMSTSKMLKRLAGACGVRWWLFGVPDPLLRVVSRAARRPRIYARLCSSLQVDISHTVQALGWVPPYSVEESFSKMAASVGGQK